MFAKKVLVLASIIGLMLAQPALAIEFGSGLTKSGDTVSLTSPVSKANGGLGVDASTGLTANFVAASPDGSSGAVSFRALVDADIPNTITASNYLPLGGGTLTGLLTTDNLGIEFEESDTNPTCSTGNFNIYADLSENKLKKCENGAVTDLGGSGAAAISMQGFCTTTSVDLNSGGTASVFIAPFSGSWFTTEDKATVPYDSATQLSDLRCKASATLGATTTIELAKGTCGSPITFDCQAGDLCASVTNSSASTVDTSTLSITDADCVVAKAVTAGDPADATYCCSWTFTR